MTAFVLFAVAVNLVVGYAFWPVSGFAYFLLLLPIFGQDAHDPPGPFRNGGPA